MVLQLGNKLYPRLYYTYQMKKSTHCIACCAHHEFILSRVYGSSIAELLFCWQVNAKRHVSLYKFIIQMYFCSSYFQCVYFRFVEWSLLHELFERAVVVSQVSAAISEADFFAPVTCPSTPTGMVSLEQLWSGCSSSINSHHLGQKQYRALLSFPELSFSSQSKHL